MVILALHHQFLDVCRGNQALISNVHWTVHWETQSFVSSITPSRCFLGLMVLGTHTGTPYNVESEPAAWGCVSHKLAGDVDAIGLQIPQRVAGRPLPSQTGFKDSWAKEAFQVDQPKIHSTIAQLVSPSPLLISPCWRAAPSWSRSQVPGKVINEMQFHFFLSPFHSQGCGYRHAAAAKLCQSCPTLCDSIDSSPPGSPIPGILQARTLEWVAISMPMHEGEKWKWSRSVMSDS